MPSTTTRLGLKLPMGNEIVNRANYTENLNILESNAAAISDLVADFLAASRGSSFVGYGFEPLGGVVRIDDDDPRIQYSVGDWNRSEYSPTIEGINSKYTYTNNIGATVIISFIGTGLFGYFTYATTNGKVSVSVDGGVPTEIDFYSTLACFSKATVLASGLAFGFHTAVITTVQRNPLSTSNAISLYCFDVITTTDSSLKLACDRVQNKSSAITYGNRNDSAIDIAQSVDEITQLIKNASFKQFSPTWGTLFHDDFNRADGVAGNGWSAGNIATNKLSLPAGTTTINGSANWTDRQIRFSFIAPVGSSYGTFVKIKDVDVNNYFGVYFLTGTTSNVYMRKLVGGVDTNLISATSVTITAGTTYYVTVKTQGNIYSASITSNPDYITGATTIYAYEDNLLKGLFSIYTVAGSPTITYDNVVVTGPIPNGWSGGSPQGGCCSTVGNILTITNNMNIVNSYNQLSVHFIPVTVGQQYTASILRKINSFTSGNGVQLWINWYQSDKTTLISSSKSSYVTAVDSNFTQVTLTDTAPALAAYAYISPIIDGILASQFQQPIFVQGNTVPAFHEKESRCDLVSLNKDGTIQVTKGTGEDELGYRVEEDGNISKFYRDKKTIPHWDRVKVWKGGTGWTNYTGDSSDGNSASYSSLTTDDAYYISFVGTGLDLVAQRFTAEGILAVSIDGGSEWEIDNYSLTNQSYPAIPIIRGLSYGQHIVKFRVTGKRSLGSQNEIIVAGFRVYVPKIPATPTNCQPLGAVIKADPDHGWIRYEENEGVVYNGTWSDQSNPIYSNGTNKYSNVNNSYSEFSFIGNAIRLISDTTNNRGIAEIYVNDVSQGTVDFYESGSGHGQVVKYVNTSLSLGLNKIKVRVTDTKNASSSDYVIVTEAFEVRQPLYVIDLRKFLGQVDIEAKIAEHEAKDLFDAHSWAVKGQNKKERIEKNTNTAITIVTANNPVSSSITFTKAFTVIPQVIVWLNSPDTNGMVYSIVYRTDITTTGFKLWASSGAIQVINCGWLAIGY